MRMGGDGPSAADVIARAGEADLAKVIFTLGEERFSRAIARAIVKARAEAPITTTKALADIVAGVVRAKPGDIHPATRTFQALRILVNAELDELTLALEGAEKILKPGGRLVVVSFHSLEDRIVKNFLNARGKAAAGSRHQPELKRTAPSFRILTKRPDVADDAETARNPRARSAKLRAAERTDAPPHAEQHAASPWPSLADVMGRA
jgi:16S rRNA (cytosine1402-N4)-methyltransferase